MRFKDALRTIHFSDDIVTKDEARGRLAFCDELFEYNCNLLIVAKQIRSD
ncbi:MAG: hypothetical protein R3C24_04345 [Cyanobacteriota/Melainabacteria group bacterium]